MKLFGSNVEKNLIKTAKKSPEKLEEAFRPYVERQFPKRLNYILKSNSISKEDAEEIVWDGFLALFENLKAGKIKEENKLNAYFSGILNNLVKKFFARDKARLWLDFADYMTDALIYYFTHRESERWQLIEENFQYLTKKCQEILNLFYFKGYSFKEIAPQMALGSPDSARTTKKRCLKSLANRVNTQIS
ncbi:MAG: sigma-70 family RNA polymerase sigma factor [Bacteroidota bacterium]